MAELKDLLVYILRHYPHQTELSNARVTKMVYMCDWKHSIENQRQITQIKWKFDNFGPFVWDILDTAKKHAELFALESTHTSFGDSKTQIVLKNNYYQPNLTDSEKSAAEHVIATTKKFSYRDFIQLVYSTYPIVTSERYSILDLPALAKEYKKSSIYQSVAVTA